MQLSLQKSVKGCMHAPDSGSCLWAIFDFSRENFSCSTARYYDKEIKGPAIILVTENRIWKDNRQTVNACSTHIKTSTPQIELRSP
jgi:hypothetical protein